MRTYRDDDQDKPTELGLLTVFEQMADGGVHQKEVARPAYEASTRYRLLAQLGLAFGKI